MQKKLSKVYLAEAIREILLSVPDLGRATFTRMDCGQRVLEEYGEFNANDFFETWTDTRQQMRLPESSP
jgi:hypothetical protein